MHTLPRHLLLLSLLLTCACSTVVEGRSEKITVDSAPQGAQCILKQADDVVGRLTTPGSATVNKTKNDLVILCSKPGYESVSINNHSDLAMASLGNAAFYELSFLGNAIDSATGASNKYDSHVFVRFTSAVAPSSFPAPPGAPPINQLPAESVVSMSMQSPMPGMPASSQTLPAAAVTPAPVIASNPSLQASAALAKASLSVPAQPQVAQLTYAEETAQVLHRPPFEITQ